MRWFDGVNGHEFEQTLGDSEGQGSLACCSPWGRKESDMNEQLNNSGDLPNPGTEPASPALTGGFFTTEPPGKPINF